MRCLKIAAVALFVLAVSQVQAQVYVGSFQVDDGPFWTTNPPTYSALEAAALLFGGVPTDYSVSTVDNNPANIDHMGWYSVIFVAGGHKFAENFKVGVNYQDPGGTSAYVQDNAQGPQFTNFVFRNPAAVPELSAGHTVSGLLAGSGVCFWFRRRRLAKQ
jgi:hypothetical protein